MYNPYLLTYLFTPWSRVLLEKLTVFQLVQKFPAFYGTQRFITAVTSARHLSLFWASLINFTTPNPTLPEYPFNIIFSYKSVYPKWSLSFRFPYQNTAYTSPFPISATCRAHLILLDFVTRIILGEEYRSLSSLLCSFHHSPVNLSLLVPNILLNTLFSNTLSLHTSLNVSDQVSHPYKQQAQL